MNYDAWLDNIPRDRLIEWWSVLNCKETPSDLFAHDPDDIFEILTRRLTNSERLGFWNGDFERGLKLRQFIRSKKPGAGLDPAHTK